MKTLAILAMFAGCGVYFDGGGDDVGPDAAVVAEPDAEPDAAECEPTLPTCGSRGCTPDSQYLDCPRSEDTSVCYCDVPPDAPTTHPVEAGWCRL